jgi:hypothetical protein
VANDWDEIKPDVSGQTSTGGWDDLKPNTGGSYSGAFETFKLALGDLAEFPGEIARRVNSGVVGTLDMTADLAELAGASPEHTFRLKDLANDTPLDFRPNPESPLSSPVVGGMSVGDMIETTAATAIPFKAIDSGMPLVDKAIDFLGLGRSAPSSEVVSALDVARRANAADQTKMVDPSQPVGETPIPRVVDDEDATMLLSRLLPENQMAMIRNASPETKQKMLEMLTQAQSANANPGVFRMPRDVVGEQISQRATALSEVASTYGQRIDGVVQKNTGMPVSTQGPKKSFEAGLSKLGINVVEDADTGEMVLDFSESAVEKLDGSESALRNIWKRLNSYGDHVAFDQMHRDKQWLSEQANYASKETGVSGSVDKLIKGTRSAMNETLQNVSPEYARTNAGYAAAIEPFREIARLTGNPMADLDDPKVIAELARKSRGLTNNTAQGVDLRFAIEGMNENVLNNMDMLTPEAIANLGIDPKSGFLSNLNEQAVFASTLDNLYPGMKPTSFQSLTTGAAETGADRVGSLLTASPTANLAKRTADFVADKITPQAERESLLDARTIAANRDAKRRQEEAVQSLLNILERDL